MTTVAGVTCFTPRPMIAAVSDDYEKDKYRRMWKNPAYRVVAPGEKTAQLFSQVASLPRGAEVIDFGAGTGRGAMLLALMMGARVTMVDFAENCLDPEVQQALSTQNGVLKFVEADLRKPVPVSATFGYCTDVMEHIPTEDVAKTLANILKAAQHVFFQISLVDDVFGATIGEPLHLTVKPFKWWETQLKEAGATITWSHGTDTVALFYASAWSNVSELVACGCLNTEQEIIDANIRSAVQRKLKQASPHTTQEVSVMLLASGPSLTTFTDEIIAKRNGGQPLVTVNGAYNWVIAQGLKPSAQIVVDAREHNKRFLTPVVDSCKYLLASQCHPAMFDAVPPEQTWIWHSAVNHLADELTKYYSERNEVWYPSPGGSTVILRAFTLLRMLGFKRFEVYGFDSCLLDDEHHAFAQPENANDGVASRLVTVECGGKTFRCTPWMASQAQEFIDLVRLLGDEVDMIINGPGLIAHIIQTAATLEDIIIIE